MNPTSATVLLELGQGSKKGVLRHKSYKLGLDEGEEREKNRRVCESVGFWISHPLVVLYFTLFYRQRPNAKGVVFFCDCASPSILGVLKKINMSSAEVLDMNGHNQNGLHHVKDSTSSSSSSDESSSSEETSNTTSSSSPAVVSPTKPQSIMEDNKNGGGSFSNDGEPEYKPRKVRETYAMMPIKRTPR